MTEVLPNLAGVLLFLLPGAALTELIPPLRILPWPRRLAYGFLLGLVAVAGSLYVGSHLFGLPLRRGAILIVMAIWCAVGVIRLGAPASSRPGRQGRPKPPGWRRSQWRHRATVALLAFLSLGLFADAVSNPVTGWDGRMIWSSQARFVREAGTVDAPVLRDARWFVNHPRYPVLLPVAQAAVLGLDGEATGADDDSHAFRAVYAAFFPALLLILWDGAVRWAGAPAARLAALAAAGTSALTFWQDGGAASAYSDLPLGCFIGAALVLLLRARRSLAGALAAGVLAAAAVLTKNEGSLLAFFVPLAAAILLLRRPDRKRQAARLLIVLILPLLALSFLASWRSGIPNRYDEGYATFVTWSSFWPGAVTRLPSLVPLAVRRMLAWDPWSAFWWIVPPVLLAGWRGFRGRRLPLALSLALAAAAALAIAWGAYSVHWDPAALLPVTWTRFLLQDSLPLLLLLALALRNLLLRGLVRRPRSPAAAAPPGRARTRAR